jgi:PKD repeat protein
MNKIFKSLLVVATMSTAAFAQVNEQEEQQHTCGTMHAWQELCNQHPGLEQSMTKFEEDSKSFEARLSGFPKDGNKVIIPVVVHVIHKGGSENISKQQIQEQINILNDDFKGLNSDTTNIPLPFRAILGKMNIEFRLATKDPMGNCTDGIVRVFSSKTDNANNANGVKSVSYWNSYNYFNVWIVNTIGMSIPGAGIVLGYAQFPSGPNFVQLASTDGVVVIHNYFGSTGTANGRKGRTLTHEAGHWFGLRHIWGDADCGDDGIDDTPVAKNPNFGICTNNFPYNVGACVPASVNPLGEMYMNYMDYSDDACMAMFSKGQVARMRSVVEDDTLLTYNTDGELISVSVTPAFRRYLSNEANLLATGTNDGAPQNPCAPIADFNRNLKMVCTNVNVQFQDVSYNGNIQSRNWTFQGGTPATATSASVNVKYESAGAYPASLDVTNPTGSSSVTRTDVVYVTDPAAASTGNFSESFATEEDYNKWLVFNDDNSLFNKWKWVNFGRTDGGSVRMENFGNVVGEIDEFITPAYNLSSFQGVNNLNMQFWLAGAERGGIPADRLVISSSTNCGQTWSIRRTIQNYALVTAGLRSSFYSAWNPGDFQPFIVNAGPVAGNTNVRFRFQFIRGAVASNNIYIDDIDFGASIGIDDVANQIGLNLFPNPSNDQTQLNFVLDKKSTVSIDLIDVLGRNVLNVYAGVLQPGEHNPTINLSSLSNGVYTVRMLVDGKLASKRLIKQ